MYTAFILVLLLIVLVILCLINVLLVAYFTLFERLILASTQLRKGPNFVGVLGLAQPLADALKLLVKELVLPKRSNMFLFVVVPFVMLSLSLCLWGLFPLSENVFIILPNLTLLFPVLLSSLNALLIILIGWSSNSKYAFQGAMRCISQIVSYELPFTILLLSLVISYGSLEILSVIRYQEYSWGI